MAMGMYSIFHAIYVADILINTMEKILNMKITFLGTGSSRPTVERSVSCIALTLAQEVLLFDCGEGSQRQMLRTIRQSRIKKIFITHFHGDHYLGIPGLLMTLALNRREAPLDIYGPPGSVRMLKHIFASGYMGLTYDIRIHEVEDEVVDFGDYSVIVFPVEHGIPAVGYCYCEHDRRGRFDIQKAEKLGIRGSLFKQLEKEGEVTLSSGKVCIEDVTGPAEKGKKIVYTGDTRPIDFPESLRAPDILIHEATFIDDADRGDTFHSTVPDACKAAKAIDAGMLILTHINIRYDPDKLQHLASSLFAHAMVAYDYYEVVL